MNKMFHVPAMRNNTWRIMMALGVLSALVMSLVMVWCNIERMNNMYYLNTLQAKVNDREILQEKLEIEKAHLLSPYELQNRARDCGMHRPRPEQIRRLTIK